MPLLDFAFCRDFAAQDRVGTVAVKKRGYAIFDAPATVVIQDSTSASVRPATVDLVFSWAVSEVYVLTDVVPLTSAYQVRGTGWPYHVRLTHYVLKRPLQLVSSLVGLFGIFGGFGMMLQICRSMRGSLQLGERTSIRALAVSTKRFGTKRFIGPKASASPQPITVSTPSRADPPHIAAPRSTSRQRESLSRPGSAPALSRQTNSNRIGAADKDAETLRATATVAKVDSVDVDGVDISLQLSPSARRIPPSPAFATTRSAGVVPVQHTFESGVGTQEGFSE